MMNGAKMYPYSFFGGMVVGNAFSKKDVSAYRYRAGYYLFNHLPG